MAMEDWPVHRPDIAGANRKPGRITNSTQGVKRFIEIASLENIARRIGALLLIVMLGSLFLGLARASRRPRGRVSGAATALLRPRIYILILVPYTGVCILLWRPFVQTLSTSARFVALFVGSFCYGVGIALVLWGRTTLGDMYNASSTLGAQLFEKHRLITRGPYQYVRHPMYLGLVLAAFGGAWLYRTWTLLFLLGNAVTMLILRGRREEQILASEFGDEWNAYKRRVPFLFPMLCPRPVG
ncbi:MAG TPA: isoprenylcysteine carboxylmethyltransferase family protein [Anaerolineae bacterium]